MTEHQPNKVRRVDIDKGDRDRPNFRSRLPAIHYGQEREDDLYAAAPPIESLRAVISSATTGAPGKVITGNDVSRAYMYALPFTWNVVKKTEHLKMNTAGSWWKSCTAHALRRECPNARPPELFEPQDSPQGARRIANFTTRETGTSWCSFTATTLCRLDRRST